MQRIFEYTQTHLMGIVLIKCIELNSHKTKQNKKIRGHENLCFLKKNVFLNLFCLSVYLKILASLCIYNVCYGTSNYISCSLSL